jgi:hemerythrin superfamily protein
MDAISLLKDDHRTVERLFKRFEKTSDRALDERRRIVDEIIRELSIHAEIEETVFYPAVREAVPPSEHMVLESLEEHHVVKWVLSELEGMAPDAERFEAKVTVLMENVRHHVEEEESDLFPEVRKRLNRRALNEVGDAMVQVKAVAPTRPHPRSPDTPPGNIVSGVIAAALDRAREAGQEFVENATGAARRAAATATRGPDTRTTKRTAKKATGSAKRTTKKATGSAKRTTRKTTGSAKKTARTARTATGSAKKTARKATGTTKRTAKKTAKRATGTTKRATGTTKRTAKKSTSRPRKAAKKRS